MNDQSWDEQFRQFLRKTGEDFRRASEEVKAEAQRLVEAAMDPEKQQKVRDRLGELTLWARRSAEGVAGAMAEAASKAGEAFQSATEKVTGATGKLSSTTGGGSAEAKPAAAPAPARKAARAKAKAKPKAKAAKSKAKSGGKRKK